MNFKKQKGPKYLSSFHSKIEPKKSQTWIGKLITPFFKTESIQARTWVGKLISSSGGDKFQIIYFGQLITGLIASKPGLPQLVFAVDVKTNEKILLFDGAIHGYNGMFVDRFPQEELDKREANTFFNDGQSYQIIMEAYYGIDYDDPEEDFIDFVDEEGYLQMDDLGNKLPFEEVKHNGFNSFGVFGINEKGREVEILAEELS